MTSGRFARVPIAAITIAREERQRRELSNIEDLADSMRRLGQINPITITHEHILVAGERRLAAAKLLGWPDIFVQFLEDLSVRERRLIELEENTRRTGLDWKDEVAAVAEIHELLRQEHDEDWSMQDTADYIGVKHDFVSRRLAIKQELDVGTPLVDNAPTFSVAWNTTERKRIRAKEAAIESILRPKSAIPLENRNFYDWLDTYSGPPFNFIHADPPYGINFHKTKGMNRGNMESYDDSPARYTNFLAALPRIPIAESCHLMLWYSISNHHARTLLTLAEQGWVVNPVPLIWGKSDNSGVIPDTRRGPRRNYETAVIASKGDRFVVQSVSNIYWGPTDSAHPSAKPRNMLTHFFRMFVDASTVMLDPMCGSGNAVRAAFDLGASSVLGLELDPNFYRDAVSAWNA